MREILFRGKDFSGVINHSWCFGSLDTTEDDITIIIYPDRFGNKCRIIVDPETVGQYTGLKDKNGTKIFEGDIVLLKGYDEPYQVVFDESCFQVYSDGVRYAMDNFYDYEIEVIGNIYDNKLEDFNNGRIH